MTSIPPSPSCNIQQIVSEWTLRHLGYTPQLPEQVLPPSRIEFLAANIAEEVQELRDAQTLVDQVDALADIAYFVIDFAVRSGLPFDRVFDAVHAANMRKLVFDQDGNVRRVTEGPQAGKILKPGGWTGPEAEIARIIEDARLRG